MQKFDRNNFKQFAENNKLFEKNKWFHNHSEIVKNQFTGGAKHRYSFRSISESEIEESYLLIGSLRDRKIKILDYIRCSDDPNDFWNPESKIATNFYPYHACDVYSCIKCNKLFLVYTEYGGHGPDLRIRNLKSELIMEEPSNCTLNIPENRISELLDYVGLNHDGFENMLKKNKDLDHVNSNFDTNTIIVKRKYENSLLFVSSQKTIYNLINQFQ